jgi:hypothetical protein
MFVQYGLKYVRVGGFYNIIKNVIKLCVVVGGDCSRFLSNIKPHTPPLFYEFV